MVVIEVKKHCACVSKRAREEEDTAANIYSEEIAPLLNREYEFVTEISFLSSIKG